ARSTGPVYEAPRRPQKPALVPATQASLTSGTGPMAALQPRTFSTRLIIAGPTSPTTRTAGKLLRPRRLTGCGKSPASAFLAQFVEPISGLRPYILYGFAAQPTFSAACSHVRFQGSGRKIFVSAAAGRVGSEVRTAGDRTRRRRLNKLSYAGWLPHDRGFVS